MTEHTSLDTSLDLGLTRLALAGIFASLAGLVNFRLAFGNYRNGHLPRKGLVDFTSSQISPITS